MLRQPRNLRYEVPEALRFLHPSTTSLLGSKCCASHKTWASRFTSRGPAEAFRSKSAAKDNTKIDAKTQLACGRSRRNAPATNSQCAKHHDHARTPAKQSRSNSFSDFGPPRREVSLTPATESGAAARAILDRFREPAQSKCTSKDLEGHQRTVSIATNKPDRPLEHLEQTQAFILTIRTLIRPRAPLS